MIGFDSEFSMLFGSALLGFGAGSGFVGNLGGVTPGVSVSSDAQLAFSMFAVVLMLLGWVFLATRDSQ